jgi:hypothetical protein
MIVGAAFDGLEEVALTLEVADLEQGEAEEHVLIGAMIHRDHHHLYQPQVSEQWERMLCWTQAMKRHVLARCVCMGHGRSRILLEALLLVVELEEAPLLACLQIS